MSVLSVTCCGLLSAICAFALVSATGCGTDAQGVDDCREIEQARCVAAKSCGQIRDVDACQRFYRDQCLHGLPVHSPGSTQVKECVATIRAAGECVTQSGAADVRLADCAGSVSKQTSSAAACDLVKQPETAIECAFLAGETGGSGGSTGTVEENGGAAGDSDAAGAGGS